MIRHFHLQAIFAGLLASSVVGCGHYNVRFHVAEVINTDLGRPADDLSRAPLWVDVLCLTRSDLARWPALVDGTFTSADWFHLRESNNTPLPVSPGQIFSLRPGRGDADDRWSGPALESGIDQPPRRARVVSVPVRHPRAWDSDSAIVVFARFRDGGYDARLDPLIIAPAPKFGRTIDIAVERTYLAWLNAPDEALAR